MLKILYTNDLHGCIEMIPRLAALIGRERQDGDCLLLDAGDTSLIGRSAELGVQLLAALGYDAMTPGNSENDGLEARRHLGEVGAPVVVANIAPGGLGFPTEPYIIRTLRGMRVAVLGLTTPPPYPVGHRLHRPSANEVHVEDFTEAARVWVPRLQQEADLVVVLSHLGLMRDTQLALEVGGIDLIVGGHSHHVLPSPLFLGNTCIVQAGVAGSYLGIVEVEEGMGESRISSRVEPVWLGEEEDDNARSLVDAYLKREWPEGLEEIGLVNTSCWADPWRENSWSNFITDSLRVRGEADLCFYKAMGLRPAVDEGVIRRWDLGRCVPELGWNAQMGIDGPVRMILDGKAIREVCEKSLWSLPLDCHELVPSYFRLPTVNALHASGLRVEFDLSRPMGERVVYLEVDGSPLHAGKQYSVVVSGFLSKGYSGFHAFREGTERTLLGDEVDVIIEALEGGVELAPIDGRLRFLGLD